LDEDPSIYLRVLKEMWMQRLREISNGVAQMLALLGEDFGVTVRYIHNGLRVWYVPILSVQDGVKRPLAEEPCPKDKWYSHTDLMAFTHPTKPDDQTLEEPRILFGPGSSLQERYDDPEVQGGKIALIAFKQKRAQKPPNCLDRMRSVLLKQIAYNQRVMEAEEEIAGINCDAPEFLSDMKFVPEEPVVICVNGSEEMKRNEEAVGGQLWMQSGRKMTAYNRVKDGMANSRESAILSAVAEAVEWKHACELDGPRKGQRVVIYPKEVSQ
jgi:hypothetical protein